MAKENFLDLHFNKKTSSFPVRLIRRGIVAALRILRLLAVGHASAESQHRLERQQNWTKFREVTINKVQSVGVVSGLLLTATSTMLTADLNSKMSFVSCIASMYMSLLSVTFCFMCMWSLVGATPETIKALCDQSIFFYYLQSTPSIFGGASAITFFIAIGAWVWLDKDQGLAARVLVIVLAGILIANACACFVIGATSWPEPEDEQVMNVQIMSSPTDEWPNQGQGIYRRPVPPSDSNFASIYSS